MVTARFLLDTNAVSEAIRPALNPTFLRRFREHRMSLAIGAPTWHELRFGAQRLAAGRRRQVVEAYLDTVVGDGFEILPYDAEAAAWHARERARLCEIGRPSPFVDGQIAAIAVQHGIPLVTHNTRDFDGFVDLVVMDWSVE